MPGLKLVLYLAEKCRGCEYIQDKMGRTISSLIENAPNISFTEVIYDNQVELASLRQAFSSEVDGVLILSCRPEDCLDMMLDHQASQNKHSLTEALTPKMPQEDSSLATAGGTKWTSSN